MLIPGNVLARGFWLHCPVLSGIIFPNLAIVLACVVFRAVISSRPTESDWRLPFGDVFDLPTSIPDELL